MKKDTLLLKFELEKCIEINYKKIPYEEKDLNLVYNYIKYEVTYSINEQKYTLLALIELGSHLSEELFLRKLSEEFVNNKDRRIFIANFLGDYYEHFALNYINLFEDIIVEDEDLPFSINISR